MEEWIEIGRIVAPQGLKGELRVNSSSDFPERFLEPGTRWLQEENRDTPEAIELLKGYRVPGKNIYVVQLEGIENRDRASSLRGAKLLVPASDRPHLEKGEFHVIDLINLEVYNQLTGENLGTVVDVYSAGNDLLEIKLHQQPVLEPESSPDLSQISRKSKRRKLKPKKPKPRTILIPFVNEIVPLVDLEKGRLEITPPDGLLELNVDSG